MEPRKRPDRLWARSSVFRGIDVAASLKPYVNMRFSIVHTGDVFRGIDVAASLKPYVNMRFSIVHTADIFRGIDASGLNGATKTPRSSTGSSSVFRGIDAAASLKQVLRRELAHDHVASDS